MSNDQDFLGSDDFMGRLFRLDPQPGDTLIVKLESEPTPEQVRGMKDMLAWCVPGFATGEVNMIGLWGNLELSCVDEKTMNEAGWYRKPSTEKGQPDDDPD